MAGLLITHYEGMEVVADHIYDPAPPRIIGTELRAYYPDHVVFYFDHELVGDTRTSEARIVLIDKRDQGKPAHERDHETIEVYATII